MMRWLISGLLFFASSSLVSAYYRDNPVLDLVPAVAVGEPTLVRVNLSAHDPCNEITQRKGCNWPYMEINLAAAPLDPPGREKYWMPYCMQPPAGLGQRASISSHCQTDRLCSRCRGRLSDD